MVIPPPPSPSSISGTAARFFVERKRERIIKSIPWLKVEGYYERCAQAARGWTLDEMLDDKCNFRLLKIYIPF